MLDKDMGNAKEVIENFEGIGVPKKGSIDINWNINLPSGRYPSVCFVLNSSIHIMYLFIGLWQ